MAIEQSALVLNQNYEPLNVCSVRRAFVLVFRGKAEVLELGEELIQGIGSEYDLPSVIRLNHFVRRPQPRLRLTRKEVFLRDQHRCQYCGERGGDLTLDHVTPRRCGGQHAWENLVTACRACNHRKGGRTPEEARMRLLREPYRPAATPAVLFGAHAERNRLWHPFLAGWIDRHSSNGSSGSNGANGHLPEGAAAS